MSAGHTALLGRISNPSLAATIERLAGSGRPAAASPRQRNESSLPLAEHRNDHGNFGCGKA